MTYIVNKQINVIPINEDEVLVRIYEVDKATPNGLTIYLLSVPCRYMILYGELGLKLAYAEYGKLSYLISSQLKEVS